MLETGNVHVNFLVGIINLVRSKSTLFLTYIPYLKYLGAFICYLGK